MNTLFALFFTFSFHFYPVEGGELHVEEQTPTSLVHIGLNGHPTCTVVLSKEEVLTMAEIMVDVLEQEFNGRAVHLESGSRIDVRNDGEDNVRVSTSGGSSCSVLLVTPEGEPEDVLDALLYVATL